METLTTGPLLFVVVTVTLVRGDLGTCELSHQLTLYQRRCSLYSGPVGPPRPGPRPDLCFEFKLKPGTGFDLDTGCLNKKGDVFIGPQIHGFTHPVFSQVCIGKLGQGIV